MEAEWASGHPAPGRSGDRSALGRSGQPGATAPVVTVSASYGAGGSVIAPVIAQRLGIPFLDRMVSPDLATKAARSTESLSEGERGATPQNRFFAYLAHAAPLGAAVGPPDLELGTDDESIRARAEHGIAKLRHERGGVVLGRGAAVVLAGAPNVFHVRLTGSKEKRVDWASRHESCDRDTAEHRLDATDSAREAYVKRLYHTDSRDASLYHLIVDTTVVPHATVIDLVVTAAKSAGVLA